MGPEFFRVEIKVQWDEGGGRILLGDVTGGGAVMLPLNVFQFLGVLNLSEPPCIDSTYTLDIVYTQFRLAQNSYLARPSGI